MPDPLNAMPPDQELTQLRRPAEHAEGCTGDENHGRFAHR